MKTAMVAALAAMALASAVQAQMGPGGGDPYGDATVSRADEQARATERFDALDINKDGAIDTKEQEAAQGQRGGPGGGGFGLRRADANENGKITKDEFLAAQLRRFDMQDANKDGQLTKAERDAARAERGGRNGGGNGGSWGGGWGGPPPGGE